MGKNWSVPVFSPPWEAECTAAGMAPGESILEGEWEGAGRGVGGGLRRLEVGGDGKDGSEGEDESESKEQLSLDLIPKSQICP